MEEEKKEGEQYEDILRLPTQMKDQKKKTAISVFGSKHPKIIRFISIMLRCLRHCYDMKHDDLNIDLNQFLLLKNELSLSYLRNYETVLVATRAAINIFASQDDANRKEIEERELKALEKIIKAPNVFSGGSVNQSQTT